MADDFLSQYLAYTGENEVPTFFHRWSCISGVAAMLGRQYSLPHSHVFLYPNLYIMLIGSPGTRKNTAINIMRSLIVRAGYDTIAADKTTKEKFLMDLAGIDTTLEEDIAAGKFRPGRGGDRKSMDQILDSNLWGEGDENDKTKQPSEIFIIAPEFNDFLGNGNIEFISLLGNLWDYNGVYKSRIKNGKSIAITDPTISIVGGNTPTGFSLAFPNEIFGQGFFSRLLLIYGEPTGKKIAFPIPPKDSDTVEIVRQLMLVKRHAVGIAELDDSTRALLGKIYTQWGGIDDVRFESYANRRFTHLLKLCLTVSAIHYRNRITERDVVVANTILSHTEHLMPRALGEFGKAKNSDVAHKVMKLLESTNIPLTGQEIWAHVDRDLEKMSNLQDMLTSLQMAKKIMFIKGADKGGFIAIKKPLNLVDSDTLDWSILTEEERSLV